MAGQRKGRRDPIERICRVFARLLDAETLDAKAVADTCEVGEAQARRYKTHLLTVTGVRDTPDGICFSREFLFDRVSRDSAVAAALMSGLAALFEGTRYAQAMRDALTYVASRSVQTLATDGLRRRFHFAVGGGDPALAEKAQVLETVVQAVLDSHKLRLRYVDFQGRESTRVLDPLTLLVYEHQLYVVAREEKDAIHAFRFSRIESAQAMKQPFEYPPPTAYNLQRLLGEVWGVFIGIDEPLVDVVVQFAERWRSFAETHRWHPSQENLADGRVRFHLRPCPEFKGWLLGFGRDLEVLEPQSLRAWAAEEARAMAERYASAPALSVHRA